MKKLTSILLTIAVLTSLITSTNAYNSKIYDSKLIEALNNANEDDLIPIYLWRKDPNFLQQPNLSDLERIGMSSDEINALYISVLDNNRAILKIYDEVFKANHINSEREIFYEGVTPTMALEATPAEILYYAELDEVNDISLYEVFVLSNDILPGSGSTLSEEEMPYYTAPEYTIDDALEILRCLAKLPSVYDNVEIKPVIGDALNILRVLAKLDLD